MITIAWLLFYSYFINSISLTVMMTFQIKLLLTKNIMRREKFIKT